MQQTLQTFLFKPSGHFGSPAELGRKLACVSDKYKNPKSVEALLSQILRYQKPIPDALADEIKRLVCSEVKGQFDPAQAIAAESLKGAIVRHNARVAERRVEANKSEASKDGHDSFLSKIHKSGHRQQLAILNAAWIATWASYTSMQICIGQQCSALNLYLQPPLHPWDFSEGKSAKINADVNISFWVPNKAVGIEVWGMYFRCLCINDGLAYGKNVYIKNSPAAKANEVDNNAHIIDPEKAARVSQKLAAVDGNKLHIHVLSEPSNAVCHTCVLAFSPEDIAKLKVYGLVNDRVNPYSNIEALSWREALFSARSQVMANGAPLRWKEAEDAIMKECTS